MNGYLEKHLREQGADGRKLLVVYLMGGMTGDWVETAQAIAQAGADAIEVGIPFSDPMIDGPTIQQAGLMALQGGTTPNKVISALSTSDIGVPLCVMTYYNLVFRAGHKRFASSLAEAGISGAIVPDLSLEESGPWCEEADAAGVATVMLVAPSTPEDRARRICERSRGFVYGVGIMGVTGERTELASSARQVAQKVSGLTDKPVCIGIGVSNAQQAAEVCSVGDGVVVGSALVRRLLEGQGPRGAAHFVKSLRNAIDAV